MNDGHHVHHGDNLDWLRSLDDSAATLAIADPPYFSGRDWGAFSDIWTSPAPADLAALDDRLGLLIDALADTDGLTAYLAFMAARLIELHRVTGATGSVYVFCDDAAVAELRVLMDAIWGRRRRAGLITWKRTTAHNMASKNFARVVDFILYYRGTRAPFNRQYRPYSPEYIREFYKHVDDPHGPVGFYLHDNLTAPKDPAKAETSTQPADRQYEYKGRPPPGRGWRYSREKMEELDAAGRLYFPPNGKSIRLKRYLSDGKGRPVDVLWDDLVGGSGVEGEWDYPTAKPVKLMERIVTASSNVGDLVIDPFCGSGSSLVAARKLDRRVAGCDSNPDAVTLTRQRLDALHPSLFLDAT